MAQAHDFHERKQRGKAIARVVSNPAPARLFALVSRADCGSRTLRGVYRRRPLAGGRAGGQG